MQVNCPHCGNSMEFTDDLSLVSSCCSSCGGSFNLINYRDTVSYSSNESKILGHFKLIECVGMGKYGAVWKALDNNLNRTVAVKISRKTQLDPKEAEHFFREARSIAQLHHPHIVSIHEIGSEGGFTYFVSDFIDGPNLKEYLSAQRLSYKKSAQLCITLCDALHHAHEAGIIHRDLKPENIMIDLKGQPFVTDFGLAKRDSAETTMTVDGHIMGTPAYMPPEQARGEANSVDRRADIYSLGMILYELLTGVLPFRGATRMVILQVLQDTPPNPRSLNHTIPADLETICLKCLEKERKNRYDTAQELADDLKRHLASEPIHAKPVSTLGRVWRWYRRNPNAPPLIAGGSNIFGGLVLFFWSIFGLIFYFGLGQDPELDKQKAFFELVGMCSFYVPLIVTGIFSINGRILPLWTGFILLLIFFALAIFLMVGPPSILIQYEITKKSSASPYFRLQLYGLLSTMILSGMVFHLVALSTHYFKKN